MAFSSLYSAVLRGKWFISFRDVEANQILVNLLLERGVENEDITKLSDKSPIVVCAMSETEMKTGHDFSDAPQDSVAIIGLQGSMLKYGSYCSYGTTEVAEMVNQAADSPKISGILLDIDSGGGSVDAIAPLVDAIQYAQKKKKCVVAYCDLCASAAYYVACYCDEIIASNTISSEFGSIGVMMSFLTMPNIMRTLELRCIPSIVIYHLIKMARLKRRRRENMMQSKQKNLTHLQEGSKRQLKIEEVVNLTSKQKGSLPGVCSMRTMPKKMA